MPREIQSFISQYYPNTQLYSFTYTDTSYTVILKNGPTIVFDNNCKWTSINGNGSPLPQTLLFDDFPPILYNYLQETETTDQVFSVTRNSTKYVVELLNTTLTYVIATGELSSSEAAS
ncbi:MAG: PepSY-like domain-containing protein [Bacteroidales bacterium]|nr:PepSY-like domain-containing protein [Bacteroidales bacterium]